MIAASPISIGLSFQPPPPRLLIGILSRGEKRRGEELSYPFLLSRGGREGGRVVTCHLCLRSSLRERDYYPCLFVCLLL